jgi:hypothetical protein
MIKTLLLIAPQNMFSLNNAIEPYLQRQSIQGPSLIKLFTVVIYNNYGCKKIIVRVPGKNGITLCQCK